MLTVELNIEVIWQSMLQNTFQQYLICYQVVSVRELSFYCSRALVNNMVCFKIKSTILKDGYSTFFKNDKLLENLKIALGIECNHHDLAVKPRVRPSD